MYGIAYGLDHIKMICVCMLRGKDGDTCTCGSSLILFPLPGTVVGVSRLYLGAEAVGTPDWLVPITNG